MTLAVYATLTNDAVRAVIATVERLGRADLAPALGAREALLVEVLALENQIGLIGRDDLLALGTLLSLFTREAIHTERSILFVRVNALTDQL